MSKPSLVISDIGDLCTLAPLAEQNKISDVTANDLGRLHGNAWLAVEEGKVAAWGQGDVPRPYAKLKRISANGRLVMPGFVDAHTHPIYGGNRSAEFAKRLNGETYQSIAAAGGGIKSTVAHTREASDEELVTAMYRHLQQFLRCGVTTLEAKSGYGLNVEQELRLLKLMRDVSAESPLHIVATCLALHAVPGEFKSQQEFCRVMTEELLPQVAKDRLATYVDAFVEPGYFAVEDVRAYISKAQELGLRVRLHADEFKDGGAAAFAAEVGADSADHLECASDGGIAALAAKRTVAVLLPGTSLYAKIKYAEAARFRQAGVGIALATDFNPGSCQIDNINFIATIGALHCGLTVAEAVAAVTYVPAYSLKLHERKGSLAIGADADFCIHAHESIEHWIADIGRNLPKSVFIGGECHHSA